MIAKKAIKISLLIFILLIAIVLSFFLGASRVSEAHFKFTFDVPQTTIQVGETVVFTAELRNLTSRAIVLNHAIPLMAVYIFPKDAQFDFVIIDALDRIFLRPYGTIERSVEFTGIEPGEYILLVFYGFNIYGNNRDFSIHDHVIITVVDTP